MVSVSIEKDYESNQANPKTPKALAVFLLHLQDPHGFFLALF
jgi:hypothetical protein